MCSKKPIDLSYAAGLFIPPDTHLRLQSMSETKGFLMFSGGKKREHWHEMGKDGGEMSVLTALKLQATT